jgi:hypothetical protein
MGKLQIVTKKKRGSDAEARRREALERMGSNEALMRQYTASKDAFERGDPAIPGPQVRAEAAARAQRERG